MRVVDGKMNKDIYKVKYSFRREIFTDITCFTEKIQSHDNR